MNVFLFLLLSLQLGHARGDSTVRRDSAVTHTQSKKSMTITEVLARNTDRWMKIPGVTGTGEGRLHGKPCVVIFVERNTPAIRKQLPTSIDGFRVQIRAVGTIEARSR